MGSRGGDSHIPVRGPAAAWDGQLRLNLWVRGETSDATKKETSERGRRLGGAGQLDSNIGNLSASGRVARPCNDAIWRFGGIHGTGREPLSVSWRWRERRRPPARTIAFIGPRR